MFLDANENPYGAPYNRYPDPLQRELKKQIAKVKGIPEDMIFLGNGSDEAIDLPYRIFCEPGKDNVVAIQPTYGMYKVCADIQMILVCWSHAFSRSAALKSKLSSSMTGRYSTSLISAHTLYMP